MNKENITHEVISRAIEYVEAIIDFSKEQVPLLVQEILAKGIAMQIMNILFCILVILAGSVISIITYKKYRKCQDEELKEIYLYPTILIPFTLLVLAFPLLFIFTKDLISIWIAPRVYVLNQLKHLF